MEISFFKTSLLHILLITGLLFFFCSSQVMAAKLAPLPNSSPLQPIPQSITPNISHSVNSTTAPDQAQDTTPTEDKNTSANPLSLLTNVKSNKSLIIYALLTITFLIIVLIAFLIFLNLKKKI